MLVDVEWSQRLGKKTGRIGNQRKNQDHSDYSFVEISLNAEKSPGNLRRLDVTKTPVNDLQLMQGEKLPRSKKNIID